MCARETARLKMIPLKYPPSPLDRKTIHSFGNLATLDAPSVITVRYPGACRRVFPSVDPARRDLLF